MKTTAILSTFAVCSVLAGASLSAVQPPPPRPELPAPPADQPEAIELTRGPIHEAFAQPYAMKSGGDFIVTQTPPEPIDEFPPGQLPESREFQWVPGYWGWEPDEERFVWISGLWRRAPEQRVWNPGYWVEVEGGYTWVSGSWIKEGEAYLITQIPPDAREENPGNAPSPIHFWVPGHWVETGGGFAWSPGFWSRGYEGRVWVPFRYQWTPQGYVALQGYWDYALEDRGVLYSPVAFERIPPPTYRYSPTIVTRVDYLPTHLFIYRNYGHYCFGDYYGFRRPGVFISWTSSNYRFYDPLRFFFLIFHRDRFDRHRHRHDYFHDHADYRPRHTWRDQRQFLERMRDNDDFDRDNFRDAMVSTGFNSLLNGEEIGTRVRFNRETQDKQRWNEIVQQNVRTRQLQKSYEQDLKKLGKIEPGKGRFPADNIKRIGPLQIETRQTPAIDRSGRVGGNSGKGITINPGRKPTTTGNSRFQPNTRDPRFVPGKINESDTLKKLREQAERMRREAQPKPANNEDDKRREAIEKFQQRQRELQQKNSEKQRQDAFKAMQQRQQILKKQAEDRAKQQRDAQRKAEEMFRQQQKKNNDQKKREQFQKDLQRRQEALKKQAAEQAKRRESQNRGQSDSKERGRRGKKDD